MDNPGLLLFGNCCVYPFLFFAIPAFLIGRFWGRVKLRSPIAVSEAKLTPNVLKKSAPRQSDPAGFGAPRQ